MKPSGFSLLLISIFLFANINAQNFLSSVKGRITDKATGSGLAGVNVFISETVWGASTDFNGYYEIKDLPEGNHELVVSIIGFSIEIIPFKLNKNETKNLNFELIEKAYELETIEVVSERPENWDNNLEIFKKYFIGQSDFKDECKILNEEYLTFDEGVDDELYVSSERPLKIRNDALGYYVEVILVSFKWDPRRGRVQYSIKPNFKEMETGDEAQNLAWNKNREKAYLGSVNHFFRCLQNNTFSEKGYTIYLVPRLNRNPQFVANMSAPIESSSQIMKPGSYPGEDVLDFGDRLSVEYSTSYSELKVSYMDLNYKQITIDQFGYPEEYMAFQTIGYWSNLGIADWLPKYFNTDSIH